MRTDIEIARQANMKRISDIASELGISDVCEPYGNYKAKISSSYYKTLEEKKSGKLILVTAMSPTPAGEGKTTITVGLADGLSYIGEKACAALREPSLGPVFGMKGGAAGGGMSQVVPMEDLNLHFMGDLHAITAANNLLAALIDNHIYQGNELDIDIENILWRRCLDMNDRQLRNIQSGLGKKSGVPRMGGFDITAASEVMAVLCLATSMADLKKRLANITVALDTGGNAVTAGDLNAHGAMAVLLKDAFNPNLVQTLENTPVFVHGGPFANIAHGCSSLIATKMANKLFDYTVTEAGFGADLGAEKFLDIKCRIGGLNPDAVVLVATCRALKYHGGVVKEELTHENIKALEKGFANLEKHIENIKDTFGLNVVVAINKFSSDTEKEIEAVKSSCEKLGVKAVLSEGWEKGGAGMSELAREVKRLTANPRKAKLLYDTKEGVKEKMEKIAAYYGAGKVEYTQKAEADLAMIEKLGYADIPVCVAKTQYSLSCDAKAIGRPEGFTVKVKNFFVSSGAGFVVAVTGSILRMPGLPKVPAAGSIDIDEHGEVIGLF